jgi:hypothetical protein
MVFLVILNASKNIKILHNNVFESKLISIQRLDDEDWIN